MSINNIAKEVFEIESKEIANLALLLTEDFENAIKAVLDTNGKFIISGMGKSGIIGKKIAATLASTGTPSFFLHPGEAYHGDLGMIEKEDILLLISNSGETDEVLKIIPFLKSQGNITITMSGNPRSTLAKNTDFHLNIAIEKEACPLQLAPMSSTTATLVMGVELQDGKLRVKRELESGWFQWVTLPFPACITIQSGLNQPRYPSLKGIMGAKKKEIKSIAKSDVKGSGAPMQEFSRMYTHKAEKRTEMIEGSTDQIVEKMIDIFKKNIKAI